ncbi:MAG: hypothetical protein ACPGD8_06035, partial [Flavobacteriales bacterium]
MLNKNRILGLFVAILMLASASNLMAQSDNVGVGTTTPQPSAILDIANPYSALTGARSKGVLVPAVTQLQRDLMEAD